MVGVRTLRGARFPGRVGAGRTASDATPPAGEGRFRLRGASIEPARTGLRQLLEVPTHLEEDLLRSEPTNRPSSATYCRRQAGRPRTRGSPLERLPLAVSFGPLSRRQTRHRDRIAGIRWITATPARVDPLWRSPA